MPRSTPLYAWGRAPCDECPHAQRCKADLMACLAFAHYVNGMAERRWIAVVREPCRALYESILMTRRDIARGPESMAHLRAAAAAAALRKARTRSAA